LVCFVDSELRAFGSIEAEKKLKNRLDFAALELDAEVQAKRSRVLHQAGIFLHSWRRIADQGGLGFHEGDSRRVVPRPGCGRDRISNRG
jgi:hypothetical protein